MHDKTTANPADEAAVRGLYRQLMDGWKQGSGAAFAAVFTEDGDLVALTARTSRGVGRSPHLTSNSSTGG